jgi:PhzF family phenazine biosynthesis protein
MKLLLYQLDAFTDSLFSGNPAAVVPLESWLSDELMQNIACENNLSETVFFVPNEQGFQIRWFTPSTEVDLCGHATLAAAYVIFFIQNDSRTEISFESKSGTLKVSREDQWLTLDFPVDQFHVSVAPPALSESIWPISQFEVFKGKSDLMVVLDNEKQLRELKPDVIVLSTIPARGVILTAPGDEVDFVSRFFAPQSGIDEDPVTGSAHTTLIPYWAERLCKTKMTARQVSPRGGYLRCELAGDRTFISGQAKLYLTGEINVE